MDEQTKDKLKQAVFYIIDHSVKNWFYELLVGNITYEYCEFENEAEDLITKAYQDKELKIVVLEDRSDGDGSEYNYTIKFPQLDDILVTLNGYYSSWSDAEFTEVFLSKPYEFKEIRYEKI